jgi:hypothetical protein
MLARRSLDPERWQRTWIPKNGAVTAPCPGFEGYYLGDHRQP